jgi:DNA polymerase-4
MRYIANSIQSRPDNVVMYVDMNSFFASCEQQARPECRGKPVGVCAGNKSYAVVIAPSIEAKRLGVRTGMRLTEIRQFCPQLIALEARPVLYRRFHIEIMKVLGRYCNDVLTKSIDEAAMNLSTYKLVYKDMLKLGRQIKAELRLTTGPYVPCSIGIAPNTFLAKLATDIQKPDGLVEITPENLDGYLAQLQLRDLPGIASRNERRLQMIGVKTPL